MFGARAPTSSLSSALDLPSNGHPSRFPDQLRLEALGLLLTRLRRGHSRVTSPEAAYSGAEKMEVERGLVIREVFNKCCIAKIALQAAMRAVYSHLDLAFLRSACCVLSGPAGVAGES